MSFTTTILQWFKENGRALPWRETRDPYAIWLSEIILQQTRIEQGRPYWERFMKRWPTVEALAQATEDEVLREWQGLGYYSRARNLHTAAQQVVAMGGFPTTLEGIKALKGVGDYTAAAERIHGVGAGLTTPRPQQGGEGGGSLQSGNDGLWRYPVYPIKPQLSILPIGRKLRRLARRPYQ